MHASLGDDLVAPALEGLSGAVGSTGGFPFGVQAGLEVGQAVDALTQVIFQSGEAAFEVSQKLGSVDHFFVFPEIFWFTLLFL